MCCHTSCSRGFFRSEKLERVIELIVLNFLMQLSESVRMMARDRSMLLMTFRARIIAIDSIRDMFGEIDGHTF